MPLQNRVTPFGDIVALPGRGLLMGNRGVLHDDSRRIVRSSQVRRWIACRTEFRGRHRTIMRPRSWTELFFLNEAAALSAGHRPCGECRNGDYRRFRTLWETCYGGPVGADLMDLRLHTERRDGRAKRTYRADLATLPDGTYVAIDGFAWLVLGSELHEWSDSGYISRQSRARHAQVDVLTPRAIVGILAAGYRAGVHPTALSATRSTPERP
jgi:hypothetical protein